VSNVLAGALPQCDDLYDSSYGPQFEPPKVDVNGRKIEFHLTDRRPVPAIFSEAIIAEEGATLYWYRSVLKNLYYYTPCSKEVGGSMNFLVPDGWMLVETVTLAREDGVKVPFIAALFNMGEQHLSILVRNAQYEWTLAGSSDLTNESNEFFSRNDSCWLHNHFQKNLGSCLVSNQ